MTDGEKFYFADFETSTSEKTFSEGLQDAIENELYGVAEKDLAEIRETVLEHYAESYRDNGEAKKYYPIYEITVKEIGYCTAIAETVVREEIAETVVRGEIISTY